MNLRLLALLGLVSGAVLAAQQMTVWWWMLVVVRLAIIGRSSEGRVHGFLQIGALLGLVTGLGETVSVWVLAGLPPICDWRTRNCGPVSLVDGLFTGFWLTQLTEFSPWLAVLWLPSFWSSRQRVLWAASLIGLFVWPERGMMWVIVNGFLIMELGDDPIRSWLDRVVVTSLSTLPASFWRGGDVVVVDGLWFLLLQPFVQLVRALKRSRQ